MATLTQAQTPTLAAAARLVVKIGSALLVDRETGALRAEWLRALALDVAMLKARGVDVILVSSGSIALGRGVLALGQGALSLDEAQAAAAVGQIRLARAYEEALAPHGIVTAQILLTLDDSADRRRYLNTRATMAALLARGVVPIVNENDTIAKIDTRYGRKPPTAGREAPRLCGGRENCVLASGHDGSNTANTAPRMPCVPSPRHPASVVAAITPRDRGDGGHAGRRAVQGGTEDQADGRPHRHGGGLRRIERSPKGPGGCARFRH